jgi:hypothetical protein
MKYIVYLVIIVVVALGAWLVKSKMLSDATKITGPTPAMYTSHLAASFSAQGGTFAFPKAEDLATAGRDLLGKEAVAEWLKPIMDAGWVFKGCNDAGLPGNGKSAVFVFEMEGKRVLLFGQAYHGIPDLTAHKGQCLTVDSKSPIVETRMYWNGGGVVYYATSDQAGAVELLAKAFGWPAPSGKW